MASATEVVANGAYEQYGYCGFLELILTLLHSPLMVDTNTNCRDETETSDGPTGCVGLQFDIREFARPFDGFFVVRTIWLKAHVDSQLSNEFGSQFGAMSHKPYGAHTKKAIRWLIWLVRKLSILGGLIFKFESVMSNTKRSGKNSNFLRMRPESNDIARPIFFLEWSDIKDFHVCFWRWQYNVLRFRELRPSYPTVLLTSLQYLAWNVRPRIVEDQRQVLCLNLAWMVHPSVLLLARFRPYRVLQWEYKLGALAVKLPEVCISRENGVESPVDSERRAGITTLDADGKMLAIDTRDQLNKVKGFSPRAKLPRKQIEVLSDGDATTRRGRKEEPDWQRTGNRKWNPRITLS
ncbi:hypothetical protein C8R45DRAFT_926958 [Mycena sanguinolenta]|nr:hypothetical protein C8R45DRAFT_926958 [Mycena sanguinolenta]